MNIPTIESFIADVENFKLKVLLDSGVNRHLRFSNGSDSANSFQITTWPDHLCISGDRGTYVFTRTSDMFNFFHWGMEKIDFRYVSEKCVSSDKIDGISKYDPNCFKEYINEYIEDNEDDLSEECLSLMKSQLLDVDFDFEYQVREAAESFYYFNKVGIKKYLFRDFWEVNLKSYSYNYIWCIYAIVYGIKTYKQCRGNNESI
jgi:hypothetical protein